MKLKKKLLFLLIYFYSGILHGQNSIKLLTNENNTFFNELNNEIWIASLTKGFNIYRGIDTRYINLNDSISGLKGTLIQSDVIKGKNNKLWTSTYEYLCCLDHSMQKFDCTQLILRKDTLKSEYRIISVDTNQEQIILRVGKKIVNFDIQKKKITKEFGNTLGNYFTTWKDTIAAAPWLNNKGFELWIRKKDNWLKENINFSSCLFKFNQAIIKILKSRNEIWLCTPENIILYNNKEPCLSKVFSLSISKCKIRGAFHKEKKIYLASNLGTIIFDISTKSFQLLKKNSYQTDDIFVTSDNTIWESNFQIGLLNQQNASLQQKPILGESFFYNQISSNFGLKILSSSRNDLLIERNNKSLNLSSLITKQTKKGITKVIIVNSNEILWGIQSSIYKYDITKNKVNKIDNLGFNTLYDLTIFKDSIYVVADEKLFIYDYKKLRRANISSHTKNKFYHHLNYFNDSIKTFGINSSEFLIRNNKGAEKIIDVGAFFDKSIFDSKENKHYLATYSGLRSVDKNYLVEDISSTHPFLKDDRVYNLDQDTQFIYFSTKNRIGRLDKLSRKIDFFDKLTFLHPPSFEVVEDTILIASNHFSKFSLNEAFNSNRNFDVLIDYFYVNGKNYRKDLKNESKLSLNHKQNSIEWMAYTNNWYNSNLAMVKYKLSPVINEWKIVENGKVIEYPLLSPGTYELSIQGILPSGKDTEIKRFSFKINEPWYNTWWFKGLLILSSIGAMYFYYRTRLNRIQERHRIENEINDLQRSALQAQMNPHFIFNCLNSIQQFIMSNDKVQAMEYLSKFAKLIRQYLNASANNQISLHDETSMLNNYCELEALRFNHKFSFNISTHGNMDTHSVFLPPMLIQPFVENAILHGLKGLVNKKGHIEISFKTADSLVEATIADNGSGMQVNKASSENHRSLGMSITQQRLAYINDSIKKDYKVSIDSSVEGTIVQITIPLKNSLIK
jgi:hypothetical protein